MFVCSGPRALGSDGLAVSLGLAATRLEHGLRAAAFWARLLRKGSDWGATLSRVPAVAASERAWNSHGSRGVPFSEKGGTAFGC